MTTPMETNPIISDANNLQSQYDALTRENAAGSSQSIASDSTNPNDYDKYSKYLYPTLIALPMVIVLILILASSAQMVIKIFAIIFILLSLFSFYAQQQNINILKYIKKNK